MDHNFGSWMDLLLMGKLNDGGGWLTINFLSTSAHTIWGVLVGKLLMDESESMKKVQVLAISGLIALILGYGMDLTGITPIIKRIATTSFVLASGGWCLLTLAALYWLIDIKGYKKGLSVFTVIGTNPIFIYMFSNTVGGQWFNGYVAIYVAGLLHWTAMSELWLHAITALVVLALEWSICFWLYTRKIFFKI